MRLPGELNYQPNPVARALRSRQSEIRMNSGEDGSRALIFAGARELSRAIQALRQAGLRVPGDASVVGFDDLVRAKPGLPASTVPE